MTRARLVPETVIVHVPYRLVKRGGRKEMILPVCSPAQRVRVDNTMIKALARAFRWKRMMDSGQFASTAELAERERIAATYMTRILRLTLLAPDIIDAIVDGRQGLAVTLAQLLEPLPLEWHLQQARFASISA